MAEIKTGWLKDYNGEKFAPITDARQVYFNGTKDENVQEVLSKKPGRWVKGEKFIVDDKEVTASDASILGNLNTNIAIGSYSTVIGGTYNIAKGAASVAHGYDCRTDGLYSHAEGQSCNAQANYSHAEGGNCITKNGLYSHAEGIETIATTEGSHVQGKYNIEDTQNKYAHIIGNGGNKGRSNAHTLDWGGNAWFSGDVYIKSTSGTNKDSGSKKLATEEYVDSNKSNIVIREW